MLDYLIVGGGLAGSTLAYKLSQKGAKIHIIADSERPSSSNVAGGMFNPITGKYLAKTWLAEELYQVLFDFYSNLEKILNTNFFHPVGVIRLFNNTENQIHFLAQIEKFALQDWVSVLPESDEYPLGGLKIKNSGWLDVEAYVNALQTYFIDLNSFSNEIFDFENLKIFSNEIEYKGIKAKNVIFAEGFYVKDNPWFSNLPFNPVKGEVLEVSVKAYKETSILNQGKWIIPLNLQKLRIGATYSWHDLDFIPTEIAKSEIETASKKIGMTDYAIINHKAGVRPATVDRRPIIGSHPVQKNVLIFNGLGTKGVSLAPYFADEFVSNLIENKHLNPEVNIERFYSLYS
jgi:glycine/D-amino acid oxidase-like deaminating enzyme